MKESISEYIKNGWVKILRTGRFTDRRKRQHQFDEDRLQRIADNYKKPLDFSLAAITATHDSLPTTPNLGKIEKLKRVGEFLLAKPVNVVKDMVKVLKDIGYGYVSTSLNPNDTINHLALVPNPAVSGLDEFPEAALNFSQPGDSIELIIEFSALEEEESKEPKDQLKMWISALLNEKVVKPLAKQFKFSETPELIFEETQDSKNQEELKNIDDQKEENIMFTKKKKKPDEDKPQEQDIETADDSPGEEKQNGDEKIDFAAALAAAENAKKEALELKKKLAAMEQKQTEAEVAEFCKSLKPGVILPKHQKGLEKLLTLLAESGDTFDFSADGKGEEETPYDFAKSFLSSLEQQIPLDPLKKIKGDPGDDDEMEFSDDVNEEDIELNRKAKAIMKEDKCNYEEALEKAERR